MKFIIRSLEDGLSITESLILLLQRVGYYSFNRFMAKHGFNINYCLAIHKLQNKNKKVLALWN